MLRTTWKRSLFTRVFVHGLLVLLVSSATLVGLGALLVRPFMEQHVSELGRWLAPEVCRRLTEEGVSAAGSRALVATAYTADGRLLRSLIEPPIPPLSPADVSRLRRNRHAALSDSLAKDAFWCERSKVPAYVEFGPPPPPPIGSFVLPLMTILVVVALASIPFARSIARPIAELVRVTGMFGGGNLTARIKFERKDEVGALARAFNTMAERIQRLILAEKELLANVSHEFRTPLARIRVVLETAMESPRRAESLLQEIGRDLTDVERLVESVTETMRLDIAEAGSGDRVLPAQLQPTDVVEIVEDAVCTFRATYPAREIRIEGDGDGPFAAVADGRLLRRLLENLLDNARKYSDETAPIVLRIGRQAEHVKLEVLDRGIGIQREDLARVFEPFFRGQRNRVRAERGVGLGLALVRRIVNAHGGEISLSSEVDVGTSVRVSIPSSAAPSSSTAPIA